MRQMRQALKKLRDAITATVVVVVLAGLVWLALCRGIFVSEDTAIRALETQGYNDVVVTDHAYLFIGLRGGDGGDAARFICQAINPAGKEVEVYVFVGWPFKGATIRTP